MRLQNGITIALAIALAGFCTTPTQAQVPNPQEMTVTAAKGTTVTLDSGSEAGVQVGAIYGASRDGQIRARLRVIAVQPKTCTASVFGADPDYFVSVGDDVKFLAIEPLPTTPVATPNAPTTPNSVATPIAVPAPTHVAPVAVPTPPANGSTRGAGIPIGTAGISPAVTGISGQTVTINAGSAQGVRPAVNIPILRDGNVIALARVATTSPNASTARIVWQDPTVGSLRAGDAVGIVAGPPGMTTGAIAATGGAAPATISLAPSAPPEPAPMLGHGLELETGLSNAVVPHEDRTYTYLASLAATDYITSYPAEVFLDSGVRRQDPEENITFTRAQIAKLIVEALHSPKMADSSSRARAALEALATEYAKELRQLGVSPQMLASIAPQKTFEAGYTGQERLTAVSGGKNGFIAPFSDQQGEDRYKSGYDSRNSYFASHGDNLSFLATTTSGSATAQGLSNGGLHLDRAVVSYRADRLLRGLTIDAGKDDYWWGPGHFGTLLLSDNTGGFNSLHTTFKRGSYQLEGLYSPLGTGIQGGSRSLYGHNLQVQASPQVRLGIAETVLLPDTSLDPAMFASAFLPIPEFTTLRVRYPNGAAADAGKALIDPYVEMSVAKGVEAYWEFLVADYGINNQNTVPGRLGTLIGAHLYTPKDPAHLGMYAEFADMDYRTYLALQSIGDRDYYINGVPIGYPVASPESNSTTTGGALSMRMDSYWSPIKRWRFGLGIEFDDLDTEQPVLSRQQTYRLRATYDLSQKWSLTARAMRVATSDPTFVAGQAPVHQNILQLEVQRAF